MNESALNVQVGGSHYKDLAIQPVEYIHANGLGFCEGSVVKYVTRWRAKNGIADLKKARHFLDLLIELESRNAIPEFPPLEQAPAVMPLSVSRTCETCAKGGSHNSSDCARCQQFANRPFWKPLEQDGLGLDAEAKGQ